MLVCAFRTQKRCNPRLLKTIRINRTFLGTIHCISTISCEKFIHVRALVTPQAGEKSMERVY